MGGMSKVRVSLKDADGHLYDLVGYQDEGRFGGVWSSVEFAKGKEEAGWYLEHYGAPAIPVVELPRGLGAVVEVQLGPPTNDSERFIRVEPNWWYPTGVLDAVNDSYFDRVSFTVLSEGVE